MSALRFSESPSAVGGSDPGTVPIDSVHLEDTFAGRDRLWLRGRLAKAATSPDPAESRSWWRKWWTKEDVAPLPTIRIETRIGGRDLFASAVQVESDGCFEACFTAHLPPSRRGWLVARNRISIGEQVREGCNLIILPPPHASAAIVVLLPTSLTFRLDRSDSAPSLDLQNLIRRVQNGTPANPVYYVACVLPEAANPRMDVAAALNAWRLPNGHLVLLPTTSAEVPTRLYQTVERFRWLFAGSLDLAIINGEPSATAPPVELREPPEEWAVVRRFISADQQTNSRVGVPHQDGRSDLSDIRPTRGFLVPRYPVVFCHGMLAFSMLRMQLPDDPNCFSCLRNCMAWDGLRVLFPRVPPTSGVEERAKLLRDRIRAWTDEPINIIAHSMGGLDARYMITHLDMAGQVRSLTTVSTPHRGTYLADWFVHNYSKRVPLLLALEAFGINVNGFRDCRIEPCRKFNEKTPNHPQVYYFSYGGEVPVSRVSPVLRRAWSILTPVEGPNDGLVSSASARWGEYLGTVAADHFAQTPDAVFLRPGEDFDAAGFYRRLIENLARRGF